MIKGIDMRLLSGGLIGLITAFICLFLAPDITTYRIVGATGIVLMIVIFWPIWRKDFKRRHDKDE